jgi:hypothetical protein
VLLSGVVLPVGTDELSLAVDVLELELEAVVGVLALDDELLDCEVVSQAVSHTKQASTSTRGEPVLIFMICPVGVFLRVSVVDAI